MSLLKRNIPYIIWRNVSTNKVTRATADISTEKDKYYHRIGTKSLEDSLNVKPQGWSQAKPFEAIPGPKPLPILGNMWRFLPGGEFYNVQLIDLHRRLETSLFSCEVAFICELLGCGSNMETCYT